MLARPEVGMVDSPEGHPGWRERRAQQRGELRAGSCPDGLHAARIIRSSAGTVDADASHPLTEAVPAIGGPVVPADASGAATPEAPPARLHRAAVDEILMDAQPLGWRSALPGAPGRMGR